MRIIVADDHRIMREGVRMLLADHPTIEVVGEAPDAETVLNLLETTEADVILMDLEMPGIGGLEAIGRLREQFPEVGIVILSMHDRPDYVRRAIRSGAGAYLLKSASRDEVVRALETVSVGGSYVQSELVGPLVAGLDNPNEGTVDTRLTSRELQVLGLMARGRDTQGMAAEMGISEATVRSHVKSVFGRLGVHTRAEAVAVGLREGLID